MPQLGCCVSFPLRRQFSLIVSVEQRRLRTQSGYPGSSKFSYHKGLPNLLQSQNKHNHNSYYFYSWQTHNLCTVLMVVLIHFCLMMTIIKLQPCIRKLDGVGPVDNRPSTNKLHHFIQKKKNKKKCDIWHVTCDMWHVTRDTWHVTRDTFGGVNILSKFQLPSSYRLWFMILWRCGGKGWIAEWMNEWMNDEAVYRTAPATPGLLNTEVLTLNPSKIGTW